MRRSPNFAKDETDDAGSREMNRQDHNGNIDQATGKATTRTARTRRRRPEEQALAAGDDSDEAAFMAAQQSAIAATGP